MLLNERVNKLSSPEPSMIVRGVKSPAETARVPSARISSGRARRSARKNASAAAANRASISVRVSVRV